MQTSTTQTSETLPFTGEQITEVAELQRLAVNLNLYNPNGFTVEGDIDLFEAEIRKECGDTSKADRIITVELLEDYVQCEGCNPVSFVWNSGKGHGTFSIRGFVARDEVACAVEETE